MLDETGRCLHDFLAGTPGEQRPIRLTPRFGGKPEAVLAPGRAIGRVPEDPPDADKNKVFHGVGFFVE